MTKLALVKDVGPIMLEDLDRAVEQVKEPGVRGYILIHVRDDFTVFTSREMPSAYMAVAVLEAVKYDILRGQ